MGKPPHILHERRRFNRSREGNFDLVVDRRSLLSSMDDSGADDGTPRASRLALDPRLSKRSGSVEIVTVIEPLATRRAQTSKA